MQDTDAFVLVYDICSPDSFDYVKALRQRISETRWGHGHRYVWAVEGSFCHSGWAFAQGARVGSSPVLAGSRACRLCGLRAVRGWCFLRGVSGHRSVATAGESCLGPWGVRHGSPRPHLAHRPAGAPEAPILVVGNKRDRQRLRFGPRRALAALVRRGWRCGYLECSAKYNWHVLRLFRELLRCALVRARPAHPALRLQGALHPARCSLM